MVDLAALRSARPDLLDSAAHDWQALGAQLASQVSALNQHVTEPLFGRGGWSGPAANAANSNLANVTRQVSVTQEYAATMSSLMRDAAGGVRDAQFWLKAAESLASQNRLTISADGTVSAEVVPPLVRPAPASLINAPSPAESEVADLVAHALTVANKVDEQITAGLLKVQKFAAVGAASELRGANQLTRSIDQESLPPAGTDPAQANAWWKALDHEQQLKFINEFPSQIGWMNGLPSWARNQANRDALRSEQQQLTKQLASLEAHEPVQFLNQGRFWAVMSPAWQRWNAQVSQIETKLQDISTLESGLDYAGSKAGKSNVFLLGFDTNGNGHAIVAVGNPDTAVNTVTYVPGLTSKLANSPLGNSRFEIGQATSLWQEAEKLSGGKPVSSIYWLGYNAPQIGPNLGLHNLDVASTSDAKAGALSLGQFQSGLQAAHQAGPNHSVVFGHSYGSVVVGEAAAHGLVHPDDIIFAGSPGVTVNSASQLGISPAHVWAGANADDPVPKLPSLKDTELPMGPIDYHKGDRWFGTDPTSSAFGGKVFNANIDPSRSFFPGDFNAHESYWDPGSSSLFNMASIVDGQYGNVTRP